MRDGVSEGEGGELWLKSVGRDGERGDAEGVSENDAVKPHGEKPPTARDQGERVGNIPKPSDRTAGGSTDARGNRAVVRSVEQKKDRHTPVLKTKNAKRLRDHANAIIDGRDRRA